MCHNIIKSRTDVILVAVVPLERLALAAPAELGELVVGFVGGAKLEGVVVVLRSRRFLDGVEVLEEIGYRCVGVLGRSVSTGSGKNLHKGLTLASDDTLTEGSRCISPEAFAASSMSYLRAGDIEGGRRGRGSTTPRKRRAVSGNAGGGPRERYRLRVGRSCVLGPCPLCRSPSHTQSNLLFATRSPAHLRSRLCALFVSFSRSPRGVDSVGGQEAGRLACGSAWRMAGGL